MKVKYKTKPIPRTCFSCDGTKTYVSKVGHEHWYKHNESWYCNNCNNKLFKNPKWHPITNARYPNRGDKNKESTISKKRALSKITHPKKKERRGSNDK